MSSSIDNPFIPPALTNTTTVRRGTGAVVPGGARRRAWLTIPGRRLRLAALRRRTFGVVLVAHFMSPRKVQQLQLEMAP